jgi:hypothetical protein
MPQAGQKAAQERSMKMFPALLLSMVFTAAAFAKGDPALTPYKSTAGKFAATFRLGMEEDNKTRRKLESSTLGGKDANGNPIKTYTVSGYIHIDTDNEYTEKVSYTDYAAPVTAGQLAFALEAAMQALKHRDANGQITDYTEFSVVNRHNVKVQKHPGLACTANDGYAYNTYYEDFAVGKRLYQLSVVTDATEEPDSAKHPHKIEAERFFNSFKLVK